MGKLTAEQKVCEYNRGRKAASEGRSRSSSEPRAYPFESDQHYEERREAFNQGYGKSVCKLRVQNRHDNHSVAGIPVISKFAFEAAASMCELRNREHQRQSTASARVQNGTRVRTSESGHQRQSAAPACLQNGTRRAVRSEPVGGIDGEQL